MVRCRGIIALLFLASIGFFGTFTISPVKATSYLPHSPITIDGNGNFTAANGVTSGTGTRSDPYIIQGWDINVSGLPCCSVNGPAGLVIENTNASFIVRTVFAHSGLPLEFGISLSGVSNGLVEDSLASDNDIGIVVSNSINVNVTGNTVSSNNWFGIYYYHTNQSSITFNNVYSGKTAGIFLWSSYHVMVASNNIHDQTFFGIDTYTTDYDTFVANNVSNNGEMGLRLLYSDYNLVYHNNFVSNGQTPPPYNEGFQVNDVPTSTHTSYNPPQNTTNRWDDGYPIGGNYFSDGIHFDNCSGPSQNICTYPDGIRDYSEGINSEYVWNNGASWTFYVITQDHYPLNNPFHAAIPMPDFSINTPQPQAVSKDSSVTIIVTINSLGNYSDTVTINITSTATNTTVTPNMISINLLPGSHACSTFTITAGNAASIGTYTLSIHASGSGQTHSSTGIFSISPAVQQPPGQPPVRPPPPPVLTPSATTSPLGIAILVSLIVGLSGAGLALAVTSLMKRRMNPDPQKV